MMARVMASDNGRVIPVVCRALGVMFEVDQKYLDLFYS
jgi:hypothetical protein